ncbi:cobalt ABC transporter permease [Amycolatopsis antarctica]|uniref:Cobalt ABC transporter permease n=1 Tax=Amycolatopsis antarctica TaxID=1854586 RepID=A0A263D1Y5_9PSEU|nr:CbiQ family ECF transporter T component [Amycolatopsis antarctica]OZM72219.1 cobalt ABC transporter permease [Amycolatopsis antarctica]
MPRALHPAAWWIWALALAAAASRTTNPILLGLIIAIVLLVVTARRSDAPWALAFRLYVYAAIFVVVMRILFRILVGGQDGGHILFSLPEIPLPDFAAGITLLGPTSAEELLGGFYDGLRLATMLLCVGAANALANPKRLLKAVPGALYEVGTAVTVALSVAPQLAESVQRVRRARRLRAGRQRGMRALKAIVIPVLEDAVDRSLMLAAAMDSRGYGRRGYLPVRTRLLTGGCVLAGLLGVCVGVYGVLDGTSGALGVPLLLAGLVLATAGFVLGGRQVRRSRYRPDRWRLEEIAVVVAGVGACALLFVTGSIDPADLYPSLSPLRWPELSLPQAGSLLLGVLPAWCAPPPADLVKVPA